MKVLIDTNVISELRKEARCDPRVARWFEALSPEDVHLSVIVVGEIRLGVERIRRRDPRAARALDDWLAQLLAEHSDRILPVDAEAAEEWGRMNVPDPVPILDGLMAATAKVNGLTLATRNVKDVARTGVAVVNPFAR